MRAGSSRDHLRIARQTGIIRKASLIRCGGHFFCLAERVVKCSYFFKA